MILAAQPVPRVISAAGAGAAADSDWQVRVHGEPEVIAEHKHQNLPGKYIKTVFLQLAQEQVCLNPVIGPCGSCQAV